MTKAEAQHILIKAFLATEELPDDITAVLRLLIGQRTEYDTE